MYDASVKHLKEHDFRLKNVIEHVGPPTMQPHGNYYQELVESIIGQQLSLSAAASITGRFLSLYGGQFPKPEQIIDTTVEELRGVGFSRAKANYVRDLAQHVIDGSVHFEHLDGLSNDDIIRELTAVKGIGEWTVHMFLIFCMGRQDVLAYGDLGIKNGIKKLYGLETVPTKDEIVAIAQANRWHPYESIACWYVWKALDNTSTT